jgi:uncharacterized OB-fold protein
MENTIEEIKVDQCKDCGKRFMAPAYICSACGSEDFGSDMVEGKGRIYSHTTIRIAPEAFQDDAPYPMAIIELPYNLRMTARILLKDRERLEIGREVVCKRKNDAGYWFELS